MLPRTRDELRGRRAARWIRESSARQGQKFGPASQRRMQDREIERLGLVDTGHSWLVLKSGWSGPNSMEEPPATKTPQFRDMLATAESGGYDVLLVGYTSRYLRDLTLALHYRRYFHNCGVAIYLCDDDLLSSDNNDWERFVEKLKASEVSSRDQSKNVRSGYLTKKIDFHDPGGHPPPGFRRVGDEMLMTPDPEALITPRRVFELSATGLTDRAIAEQVGLSVDVVRGIVRSPLYIGRLRDGTAANWPPLIPIGLWNSVAVVRAARSTTAGRPASPHRPYALSGRARCAACGRGLIGDTDFYRHPDVCPEYAAATPDRPPGWHGRRDGKGYRRENYEAVIGKVLAQVSLNAAQIARVVGMVSTERAGPDVVALKRIEQERNAAAQQVLRDRDYEALQRTMERLDREEAAAQVPLESTGVPAKDAVAYLRDLHRTWQRADGGPGRRQLVEAVFNSIEVLGFREFTLRLTPEAVAHGFHEVIPDRLDVTVGYGRGERI